MNQLLTPFSPPPHNLFDNYQYPVIVTKSFGKTVDYICLEEVYIVQYLTL